MQNIRQYTHDITIHMQNALRRMQPELTFTDRPTLADNEDDIASYVADLLVSAEKDNAQH